MRKVVIAEALLLMIFSLYLAVALSRPSSGNAAPAAAVTHRQPSR